MMSARLVACPLALVSACGSMPALAGEPPAEAKQAFADGKQAYERGDFEGAIKLFQRAQALAPAPSLHYNIGMAQERLGRYDEAATSFDRYLAESPPPQDEKELQNRDNLRARAYADRERARRPEPQQQIPQPQYAPQYAPQPYMWPSAQPIPREQRIANARRHRNNGIALLCVGGALIFTGFGLTAYALTTHDDAGVIGGGVGASVGYIVGLTLVIPGAVATAQWQKTLNRELRAADDGAAARRAALDVAAPSVPVTNGRALALGTPAIRF